MRGKESIEGTHERLKRFVRYKLATDSNARQFLENGTVTVGDKIWHQYYFSNPDESVKPEEMANHVSLQSASIDEVITNKENGGIRIRVKFLDDSKPRGFDSAMKKLECARFGRLLTYKDCQVTPADLE